MSHDHFSEEWHAGVDHRLRRVEDTMNALRADRKWVFALLVAIALGVWLR